MGIKKAVDKAAFLMTLQLEAKKTKSESAKSEVIRQLPLFS